MTVSSSSIDVAGRLFAAIAEGDIDAVRAIYAEDAEIWHNDDKQVQGPEQNLRVLRWVVRNVKDLRYEEIRRQETPGGFVQQHVLRGTAPNGEPIEVPACIVCTVVDGRITRLDEYLDSAQTASLRS